MFPTTAEFFMKQVRFFPVLKIKPNSEALVVCLIHEGKFWHAKHHYTISYVRQTLIYEKSSTLKQLRNTVSNQSFWFTHLQQVLNQRVLFLRDQLTVAKQIHKLRIFWHALGSCSKERGKNKGPSSISAEWASNSGCWLYKCHLLRCNF